MKVSSTGLGKTVLTCQFNGLEITSGDQGALKMSVESTHPVHWHVTIVMDGADMRQLIPMLIRRPALLWATLKLLVGGKKLEIELQPPARKPAAPRVANPK